MKPSRVDGSGLQVIQAGAGFQVQVEELRVGDQQTPPLQHPHDAPAEGVEQAMEFFAGGPAGTEKPRAISGAGFVLTYRLKACLF